jgi:phosphatidylinositol alpha 1,6-mannosyltransferase
MPVSGHPGCVRVALLAESFLPHMNGVTGSVLHVVAHLERRGHEVLVIAPDAGGGAAVTHADKRPGSTDARTTRLRSLPLPSYPQVRIVVGGAGRLAGILSGFRPDVVHLASPFVLGWHGVRAADALRLPVVAVYQTDVIAYAHRYGVVGGAAVAAAHTTRLHRRATLTLAPGTAAIDRLERLGVDRVRRWGRGVDTDRFHPGRRNAQWRERIAPGETVVGYVGRLAPEKQVEDLRALGGLPGVRVVIVGDGPARSALERVLPNAVFTGHLDGVALAEAVASFDVFVHPGESETFGQTIQEALASGVPVVATGAGGPVDLVRNSIDGWLYRPGDLAELRQRVADLAGDGAKRAAFAAAARKSVEDRTWTALGDQLLRHYEDARALRPLDDALLARGARRLAGRPVPAVPAPRWSRYVALGDSLTEGLGDTSRMPAGECRGWADRLAQLLAHAGSAGRLPFRYANLAVRSKRVADVIADQLPQALALRPDLVSVFVGANDLVGAGSDPGALADAVADAVHTLRATGADVLLVTPPLPRRQVAKLLAPRFAAYASHLRRVAAESGALLLDLDAFPLLQEPAVWATDRVHLGSAGHRHLAYGAAALLGVPDARQLEALDAALHAHDDAPAGGAEWLRRDVLPWAWRRMRGRTAGDGRRAKHEGYVVIEGPAITREAAAHP